MDKRKRICLITVSPETSHPQRICRGAFAQCEKYGYDIAQFASMINLDFYFKDFSQAERNIYELIDFSRFDGVILDTISLMSDINMDLARSLYRKVKEQTDIPVICIGIPLEEFETIENSNEEQIREICRHVIEVHGCKDICVLTGPKDNHEAEQRLEILLDEIERHGLSVSDEHRIYGDFWYTSGTNLARDVFNGKISKPDALIAVSDHMALGFIEEYTKLGGKVPEDICVVSFDATPEGMLDDISVTSIESNFAQCAADAVDTIRQVIEPDAEIMP
ncbi:MAG: substrate-binding domain-containing protein, partial [Ruminococcus sp.]|nr:substrate-binding domain-containing protein [Ruminococcus sp.]